MPKKKSENPNKPDAHVLLTPAQRDELRALKKRMKLSTDSQTFEYVWGMYRMGVQCVDLALKSRRREVATGEPKKLD